MLTAPTVASVPVRSGRQECEGRLPDSAKAAIYTIGQGRCRAPTLTQHFAYSDGRVRSWPESGSTGAAGKARSPETSNPSEPDGFATAAASFATVGSWSPA